MSSPLTSSKSPAHETMLHSNKGHNTHQVFSRGGGLNRCQQNIPIFSAHANLALARDCLQKSWTSPSTSSLLYQSMQDAPMKEPRKICGFPSHYIVNPLPAPNLCPSAFPMTDPSLYEPFRLLITFCPFLFRWTWERNFVSTYAS